jgi:hypothetical protein
MTVHESCGQDASAWWCGGPVQSGVYSRCCKPNRRSTVEATLDAAFRSAFGPVSIYNPSSHQKCTGHLEPIPPAGTWHFKPMAASIFLIHRALHSFYWAQINLCHPIRGLMQIKWRQKWMQLPESIILKTDAHYSLEFLAIG